MLAGLGGQTRIISVMRRHINISTQAGSRCTHAEVVEYACGLAPDLRGDFIEHVSSGMDTYSFRQPLGVPPALPQSTAPDLQAWR